MNATPRDTTSPHAVTPSGAAHSARQLEREPDGLPATVALMTAARTLGIGRTKAYELAKSGQFPCRVIKVGERYRVPFAALLRLLDPAAPSDGQAPDAP